MAGASPSKIRFQKFIVVLGAGNPWWLGAQKVFKGLRR
jgi:hypothetical protein